MSVSFAQFVADYCEKAASPQFARSNLRRGQLWFNMLTSYNSALAEWVRGCPVDPFHRDEVSPEVWTYAEQNW